MGRRGGEGRGGKGTHLPLLPHTSLSSHIHVPPSPTHLPLLPHTCTSLSHTPPSPPTHLPLLPYTTLSSHPHTYLFPQTNLSSHTPPSPPTPPSHSTHLPLLPHTSLSSHREGGVRGEREAVMERRENVDGMELSIFNNLSNPLMSAPPYALTLPCPLPLMT